MATRLREGQREWSMRRDSAGEKTYKIKFIVEGEATDGPATALATAGLPLPGSSWNFDGDSDEWATCLWDADVKPLATGEPNTLFEVEFTFSTKAPTGPGGTKNCKETEVNDPLLEPMKVSGSFTKNKEEAIEDRFGRKITNSAHEQIRGPQVEFDSGRHRVKIEQNVADLQLDLCEAMVEAVNDSSLWGNPSRTVKLSSFTWDKKFYGQCHAYYTRSFEFEIEPGGWDRDILDEGTKVLNGHWEKTGLGTGLSNWVLDAIPSYDAGGGDNPDRTNPQHFIRFKDRKGENCRVILDGAGEPADSVNGRNCVAECVDIDPATGSLPLGEETITVVDGGFGYSKVPIVQIIGRGSQATAIATVVSGVVTKITVTNGGFGYVDSITDEDLDADDLEDPEAQEINLARLRGAESQSAFVMPHVLVQGSGPGSIHVEKYEEANFLLLGVPLIL